ncbi:hypothetical protein BW43_04140 [Pseudomonas sp. RIT357]|nr:hypothetical protein BW43_04140 [Pseudomonas sp. RIT357]
MNKAAALEPCLAGYAYFLTTFSLEELTALFGLCTLDGLPRKDYLQEMKRRAIRPANLVLQTVKIVSQLSSREDLWPTASR